jgi:hypothetical protein
MPYVGVAFILLMSSVIALYMGRVLLSLFK